MGRQGPNCTPLSPNEASSTGIGLHLIELLANGVHGNPPTTQAVTKTLGCSPQTVSTTPLLKTKPTQLTEHGDAELTPTEEPSPFMF